MIHCIGDSHCCIFNGTNELSTGGEYPCSFDSLSNFRTYNIGPAIAYNLIVGHHDVIFDIIKKFVKENDTILLSFGSIDCVHHLPKQKILQHNRLYDEIIKECVDRYFQFIKKINNNIILYGPIAPRIEEVPHIKYIDKLYAIKLFSNYMNELCENEQNIKHIPMNDLLLDEKNNVKTIYYKETVHLSHVTLPLILNKIKEIFYE